MLVAALLGAALLGAGLLAFGAREALAQEGPRVSPIVAEFSQPQQTTRYTILAATPAGVTPSIKWSGPQCGSYTSPAGEPATFVWNHPHPPCDPTTGHQQTTIVVEVIAGLQQFRCTYQGAESGSGPACTVTTLQTQERPGTGAAATTSTPAVTKPVDEPAQAGNGFGLSLGLGLGVLVAGGAGVYVYTRSRNREDADTRWDRAMQAEDRAQQAILNPFDILLDRVNGAFEAYRQAVDRYRTAYAHAMSSSTEMQGMLSAWATAKEGAAKADLAFAVLTLAWGLGSLGLKIARWATTARTVAAAGETAVAGTQAVVAGTEAASTAQRTAKGVDFVGKYLELVGASEAKAMERLAAEAGVNLSEWVARYGGDTFEAGEALVKVVARMRGWHGVPEQMAGVVGRVLVNGQAAMTGRGVVAAEDLAQLSQWAQRPGFWEWLAKSADWFEEIGWAGNHPEINRYATLLWDAADVGFLKKIVEAGGDVSKLRALLGPAQAAVVTATRAAPALSGAGLVAGAAGGAGLVQGRDAALAQLRDPLMQVGDLSNFVDQFGVTDRFSAGQGYGRAVMGELWELVTAPVTTIESHYFTHQAQDVYDRFLKEAGGDLQTMGSALDDAVRALDDLGSALDIIDPDDPRNPLGAGREQALRDALRDLDAAYRSGDADWQRAHADELAERRRHIEGKIAYIRSVLDALRDLKGRLGQMRQWLNEMRVDASGGLRSVTTLMNPEIPVRLISTGLYLNGVTQQIGDAAVNEGPAWAPADYTPPVEEGPAWAPADYTDLDTPLEPQPTDAATEQRWEEMLREYDRRAAEMDAAQQAPDAPLPTFDDLPPAEEGPSGR
jgi:hypothetical protein